MSYGSERWLAAERFGNARTAQAMRFYALTRMLDAAESALLKGCEQEAVEHLRELQAHCERMIEKIVPNSTGQPRVVAA